MSQADLNVFLEQVDDAAEQGIFVREIINAGYGEAFIHKDFEEAFGTFERFKANFAQKWHRKRPNISIVTNGGAITPKLLKIASKSVDILKFSFPTSDPCEYGRIMFRSDQQGPQLLARAEESLLLCMEAYRQQRIPELRIHISPPVMSAHKHFPQTLEYLTRLAGSVSLDNLRIVTFPSTSNRAGAVGDDGFLNNFYRNHKKRYHGKPVNGVRIAMLSELNVFYPTWRHVVAVLRQRFPCLWKAGSLSIDVSGNYRYCINDAESKVVIGNIRTHSIASVVSWLHDAGASPNCAKCNQHPGSMGDDLLQRMYSFAARFRMKHGKRQPPATMEVKHSCE